MSGGENKDSISLDFSDKYAYLAVHENGKTIFDVPMRRRKIKGEMQMVAKGTNMVLLEDATLMVNGEPLRPRDWGIRVAKSGREYAWLMYRYGEHIIFVHIFRREPKEKAKKDE
jgi:hypothetical protein